MRLFRIFALFLMLPLLAACVKSEQFAACSASKRVCVEGVATGSKLDGKRVTAWETRTPQGVSYAQETSAPLGGELAKIAVGSVIPAVINAGAGIAIANKQSCGGNGCASGPGVVVNAVAQSSSDATNDVQVETNVGALCTNPGPGGICTAGM